MDRPLFSRDSSGNVAVFSALALIPMIAVTGLAMDYEATVNSKTKVQSVVDTAVLSASKHFQSVGDASETQVYAQNLISAQIDMHHGDLDCEDANLSIDSEGHALGITVDCSQDTVLMSIVGIDSVDFSVSAGSRWDYDRLEVVFVFDVSRSMGVGTPRPIDSLKTAAQDALDVLFPSSGDSPIANTKVAMVTFGNYLNAGDLFEGATGMTASRDFTAEDHYIDPVTGLPAFVVHTRSLNSTCVIERFGDHAYTDVAPDPDPPGETPINGTPLSVIENSRKESTIPNGYYRDLFNVSHTEDNPYGFVSAPYRHLTDYVTHLSSGVMSTVPGTQCPDQQPLPLTAARQTLVDYIDDLEPPAVGNGTAGNQGLAWGWYMLSENWKDILPAASEPAPYDDASTLKAIVFMTDGLNDQPDFGQGTGDPQSEAICDNIKSMTDIRAYTIGFNVSASAMDLLSYCASSDAHVFDAADAAELAEAYSAIASELVDLRITS